MSTADTNVTLLYAIMSTDGTVQRTFDSIDEARSALYAMSAPVGKHPRLVQRPRSESDGAWSPVG